MRFSINLRIFLAFTIFMFSMTLSAGEVDALYEALVDRKVSESEVLSRFSISSIDAEDSNKVFVSSQSVEDSLLRVSVHRRFGEVVNSLLELGANPNAKLHKNCSPLGLAIMNGDDNIVKNLLHHNADTRIPICWSQNGATDFPIDIAIIHYELEDDTRLMVMRKHASFGEPLSHRILVFAIVNDKPRIAREFIEIMPGYRNDKLLSFSENRSRAIHEILMNAWTVK